MLTVIAKLKQKLSGRRSDKMIQTKIKEETNGGKGMDTIKFAKGSIKMVAHRGVSGIECENTCPAFVFAGARSYWGVETDVHITKDGKYIICHDDDIHRVSGVSMVIEQSDFDELRKIQLTNPRNGETRKDLFLPTVEEYVSICKKYGKECVLEIKSDFTVPQMQGLIDIINEVGYLDGVTFISFLRPAMESLRAILPDHKAQLLVWRSDDDDLAFMDKWNLDMDVSWGALTKEFADKVHEHGHKINCWTVDTVEAAEKMKDWGVEYITTNILE